MAILMMKKEKKQVMMMMMMMMMMKNRNMSRGVFYKVVPYVDFERDRTGVSVVRSTENLRGCFCRPPDTPA